MVRLLSASLKPQVAMLSGRDDLQRAHLASHLHHNMGAPDSSRCPAEKPQAKRMKTKRQKESTLKGFEPSQLTLTDLRTKVFKSASLDHSDTMSRLDLGKLC